MASTSQTVTFDQMKGAVGSLLLLWSEIERELAASIRILYAREALKPVHGVSRPLELWSCEVLRRLEGRALATQICRRLGDHLRGALAVRNLVCHGLIGISAQGHLADDAAYLTVELSGDRRSLTWSELQDLFAWMSRSKWLIQDLTNAAVVNDPTSSDRRLEAWRDFPRMR